MTRPKRKLQIISKRKHRSKKKSQQAETIHNEPRISESSNEVEVLDKTSIVQHKDVPNKNKKIKKDVGKYPSFSAENQNKLLAAKNNISRQTTYSFDLGSKLQNNSSNSASISLQSSSSNLHMYNISASSTTDSS